MARRTTSRGPTRTTRPRRARSSRADRVTLRRTTVADIPVLVRHRRGMWEDIGGRSPRVLDRADVTYRRWVRREIRAGRFIGLLAEDRDGRPAATGVLWVAPAHPRPGPFSRLTAPYVMSMYTEPEFRRLGLASRLVQWMIRYTRSRGYPRLYLNASRYGRPVYAKLGFEDGNEMRLDLQATRSRRGGAGGARARGRRRPATFP
ncbi:MAG TPA: GNAT family N-acetyltransferase [Thermoplasmata archaeon]|nr:GNAT family N-acetyltransferase [Thermoplasmata archaeon]